MEKSAVWYWMCIKNSEKALGELQRLHIEFHVKDSMIYVARTGSQSFDVWDKVRKIALITRSYFQVEFTNKNTVKLLSRKNYQWWRVTRNQSNDAETGGIKSDGDLFISKSWKTIRKAPVDCCAVEERV